MTTATVNIEKVSPERLVQAIPAHPDGGQWDHMVLIGTDMLVADSTTELIGELIDGYAAIALDDAGDDQALWVRYLHAVEVATLIQDALVLQARLDGVYDPLRATEDELNILHGDKSMPGSDFKLWNHAVPLLLIRTDYEPFTTREVPAGNITWLDPSSEHTHLSTLTSAGWLDYRVNVA